MGENYLTYPCKFMRITQSYSGTTSHKPHTTGNIKDYPIDEGCEDTKRSYIYCPCDKMIIRRIYGVGTPGTNTIWLESTHKVDFADGTSDYCTMLITHPDDSELKKLKVGGTFKRGDPICKEGKDGATAYHFHISAGKGKISGNGWKKNSNGKWVLTTTGGAFKPEKLFFLDKDFTTVLENKGLNFKELNCTYSAGYYKVSTAALNVRTDPGTSYSKKGIVYLGEKINITKVSGSWGRLQNGNWVCLEYCEAIK